MASLPRGRVATFWWSGIENQKNRQRIRNSIVKSHRHVASAVTGSTIWALSPTSPETPVARTTVVFGIVLIVVGLVAYFGAESDNPSVTALIPAFLGGPILICGALAHKDSLRMHAMHGAVLVGLLGGLAALGRGVMGIGKLFDPDAEKRAVVFVLLTAVICLVFTGLCVRSFIDARKRREAAEAAGGEAGVNEEA